jgi:hypothetical protein
MNSNSNCYEDYEPRKKEKENIVEFDPTIIKCSIPGSITIPTTVGVGDTFTLSSLTLNTKYFCNPCTILEVTSNILGGGAATALSFQVTKQCRNQFAPVPVGPAFTYVEGALLSTSTFSFFICDCDTCGHDCCTYQLVITVNATQGEGDPNVINNVSIGAITTESAITCCCND